MAADESHDDKTQSFVALTKGTKVSHYEIIKKVGSGGMGEVYLAEDTKLKRRVALKFLSVDHTHDKSVVQQFMHEAQAAARLQHPNIITVHEVNESEGAPFISMEYVKGKSLREIADKKSLSTAEIINIGIQTARGLAVAHDSGITHRDLKPGNIMIDSNGTIKILDFGLAVLLDKTSDQDPENTITIDPAANRVAGTILYMAPEQLLGKEVSCLVDVFAFGTIMHELITGTHPFGAPSVSEISARILRDTPKRVSDELANVPYDLDRIIFRCLQKDPLKRFQSVRDVWTELEELHDQLNRNVAVTVIEDDQSRRDPTLAEKSFAIKTDLVRRLSDKNPKMIGSSLVYMDNGVLSDILVFYLHPLGRDHGHFSDVLQRLPFRAISISVFGFDLKAQLRLPLSLPDHSILIDALIEDLCFQLQPHQVVLVGHSSGTDHLLHLLTSGLLTNTRVSGLLALGCNIQAEDCFASSKLAELVAGDEDQIMSTINLFSQMPTTLDSWLLIHNYLIAAFTRFGVQTEPLSRYAADIYAPFKDGSLNQFPKWYKFCAQHVPHFKFVVDTNGYPALDLLMQEHLEKNVLGDGFHEDTIVRAPCSHQELGETDMVLKYTLEFIKALEAK